VACVLAEVSHVETKLGQVEEDISTKHKIIV